MTLDLTSYRALSFDCYGTLIDWEAGIVAVMGPWAHEQRLDLTAEELLLAYADNEAAVERETPTARYPDVLAEAFRRTGQGLGTVVSDQWAHRLGDSVPDWPAFPDSAAALARLRRHYQLIILSNVHRDGFAGSNRQLRGDFAAVVTAEDVGAYKPAENHFRGWTVRFPSWASSGPSCCTWRRASSTTTSPPSGRACHRSGSTAVTTSPGGVRRPSRPTSGPTPWSSRPWAPSRTPSTRRSRRRDHADPSEGL